MTVELRQLPADNKIELYRMAFEKLENEYPYASPRSDVPEDKKAHNPIAFREYLEELAKDALAR